MHPAENTHIRLLTTKEASAYFLADGAFGSRRRRSTGRVTPEPGLFSEGG